jgi:NAD(P)H-dependent FMN reductase
MVSLRTLNFEWCNGCESCSVTGRCVFDDDLTVLFRRLDVADGVAVAAPVYAMGMNALGKAMIERAQEYWARAYLLNQPPRAGKRRAFFISTAGTSLPGVFDCSLKTVRYFFRILGFRWGGEMLVSAVDAAGEIERRPDWLDQAGRSGARFARSLQHSEGWE